MPGVAESPATDLTAENHPTTTLPRESFYWKTFSHGRSSVNPLSPLAAMYPRWLMMLPCVLCVSCAVRVITEWVKECARRIFYTFVDFLSSHNIESSVLRFQTIMFAEAAKLLSKYRPSCFVQLIPTTLFYI